jgi:hypothetical protein
MSCGFSFVSSKSQPQLPPANRRYKKKQEEGFKGGTCCALAPHRLRVAGSSMLTMTSIPHRLCALSSLSGPHSLGNPCPMARDAYIAL